MLRWGILGTARINRRVIPAMRGAARSKLVAVASRDPARAEAHAREYGIARAVTGYQTLLDDPGIDAVYIPLPNTEHAPWTLRAIAAGKHVLCEKPLALTPVDVADIAAAASAAKVCVEEGFMYRHEPLTARVMELLGSGAIGEVKAIVSGFTFTLAGATNIRFDSTLGGGALWDVGGYPVTYAQLMTGSVPARVLGLANWTASGVDAEFSGLLQFHGGACASIYCGFRAPYRTWLEVIGSRGTMTVPNPFRPGPAETITIDRDGSIERIDVPGSAMIFVREIEDFEARVLDGAAAVVSLDESRRTCATLRALRDSAPEPPV